MNCPRCERELKKIRLGKAEVDACHGGCGGIWFDAFELEKRDEPDVARSVRETPGGLLYTPALDGGIVFRPTTKEN